MVSLAFRSSNSRTGQGFGINTHRHPTKKRETKVKKIKSKDGYEKKIQFVLKTESMQSLWNLWTHAAELISKQTGECFP